jgi:GAF domain-containing protein
MSTKEDFFRSLSKLSRQLGATQDQDKMLNLIVTSAVNTLEAKAAVIFLTDQELSSSITNVAIAQVGLSKKYIHAGPVHAIKISPKLLEDGYMYFRDATTDKRLMNHEAKKAEGIGSILSVPVMDKGVMLGILSLYTKEIRKFTKDEIDFLSILAEQGGAAIANAHLVRKLRENGRIFLKLAASISSSLDVKIILQALTEDVVKTLGIKAASVLLLDEDRRTLKRVVNFGLSDKYLNKGEVTACKNIAQALKGKTIPIKNILTDDGVQYKEEKIKESIASMLYVPIKSQAQVIGVLVLYSSRQRDFSEDEVTLVTALAYQGGLAINNACMYMAVQNDMKDLKQDIWSHKSWF